MTCFFGLVVDVFLSLSVFACKLSTGLCGASLSLCTELMPVVEQQLPVIPIVQPTIVTITNDMCCTYVLCKLM